MRDSITARGSIKSSLARAKNLKKGLDKFKPLCYNESIKEREVDTMRENLIDRMIRIYGFENPIVIQFAELCERMPDTEYNNKALMTLVKVHEENPAF